MYCSIIYITIMNLHIPLIKNVFIVLLLFFVFSTQSVYAAAVITVTPSEVIQGDPVLLQVSGAKLSSIKKLTFENKDLNIFNYQNKPSALIGIDLNKKAGDYEIFLELNAGGVSTSSLKVINREKYEAPLSVPEKLGGNSPANQTKVVSTLEKENTILAVIKTGLKSFWTKGFVYPIADHVVTDPYGYSRKTGVYTIAHKGVDFRASVGTKVVAMNRGVVRIAKTFQVYGKTIVIDHGFGVMTFYMHLSKIKVFPGELVLPGQVIGLSGATGYADSPHLHTTVRINNISIDPIKFLDLFK